MGHRPVRSRLKSKIKCPTAEAGSQPGLQQKGASGDAPVSNMICDYFATSSSIGGTNGFEPFSSADGLSTGMRIE